MFIFLVLLISVATELTSSSHFVHTPGSISPHCSFVWQQDGFVQVLIVPLAVNLLVLTVAFMSSAGPPDTQEV